MPTPRTAQDPLPEAVPASGVMPVRRHPPAEQSGKVAPSPMPAAGATPQKPRGQVQLGGLNLRGRVPSFGRAKSNSTPQKTPYKPL